MYRIPGRTALDVPTVLAAPAVVTSVAGKGLAFDVPAVVAVPAVVSSVAGIVPTGKSERTDAVCSMHHERSDSLDDCDAPDIVATSDLRQQCLEIRIDKRQRA